MINFFKWFAGFAQDQNGSASSKRLGLYIGLWYLGMIVKGSISGKTVNSEVLYMVGGIVLFCIGAVTTEFFKPKS